MAPNTGWAGGGQGSHPLASKQVNRKLGEGVVSFQGAPVLSILSSSTHPHHKRHHPGAYLWAHLWSRVHIAPGLGGSGWGRTRPSCPNLYTEDLLSPSWDTGNKSHAGPTEAEGSVALQEGTRGRSAGDLISLNPVIPGWGLSTPLPPWPTLGSEGGPFGTGQLWGRQQKE